MPPRKRTLVILGLLFPLILLSCQLLLPEKPTPTSELVPATETSEQPSPTSTRAEPSPTDVQETKAPIETPAPELPMLPPAVPGPEVLDLDALPLDHGFLDFSESITMNMEWTDPSDGPQQSSTEYHYRGQTVPESAWSLLFKDDNPFLPTSIETTLIRQQAFSSSMDFGCHAVNVEEVSEVDYRQSFYDLLDALTGEVSRSEEEVMVGERVADAYIVEESNLIAGAEVVLEASEVDSDGNFGSTTSATITLVEEGVTLESGILYLARQGGYVTHLELVISRMAEEEDAPFAEPGTLMMRTLIYEVVPVTILGEAISPPAGCEGTIVEDEPPAGGLVSISDLPRMDDASNVIQTEDTLIYQTDYSVDEVIEFYKNELTPRGWELSEEITLGMLATLDLARGDQELSISVTESGGNVLVTIILS